MNKAMESYLDRRILFYIPMVWGCIWLLTFFLSRLFEVNFKLTGIFFCLAALGVAYVLKGSLKVALLDFSVFALLFSVGYILMQRYGVWGVSDDSYVYQVYSEIMLNTPKELQFFCLNLNSWGVFLPVYLASGQAIGLSTPPFLMTTLALILVQLGWEVVRTSKGGSKLNFFWMLATGALIVVFFFAAPFLAFTLGYIHNNLLFGLCLLFCFMTLQKCEGDITAPLFCAVLNALMLMRVEGAVYALLVVFCYALNNRLPMLSSKKFARFYICILPSVFWYGAILFSSLDSTGGLAGWKIHALVIFLMACIPFVGLYQRVPKRLTLWLAVLVGTIVLGSFLKPDIFVRNLGAFSANLLSASIWGPLFWPLFGGIILLCLTVSRLQSFRNYALLAVNVCGVIFLLGFVHPFRIGWGDSGNRMMLHLVPLYILLLGQIVVSLLKSGESARE